MNTATQQFHAILFADVAGSTRLHEKLGDRIAGEAIGQLLARMTTLTQRHGSTLVKTLGDEIPCRFPTARQAISTYIAMQEALFTDTNNAVRLQMRMGLHWRPVTLENGDVFGNAVNSAARMSAITRAGQIITTKETVRTSPNALAKKARLLDTIQVKGKQDSLVIYEIARETEDATTVFAASTTSSPPQHLTLHYQDQIFTLTLGNSASIGRADNCEVTVTSPLVSRVYARIENRNGKLVFIDQSTNGSYVCMKGRSVVYLRRKELPLRGSGAIALGSTLNENAGHWVSFVSR